MIRNEALCSARKGDSFCDVLDEAYNDVPFVFSKDACFVGTCSFPCRMRKKSLPGHLTFVGLLCLLHASARSQRPFIFRRQRQARQRKSKTIRAPPSEI